MKEKFYITTAIAYVNGKPHMGHAFEFIYTDALARAYRLGGKEVRFQTGTDEHGTKIYRLAKEKGLEVRDLVDENAKAFEDLKEKLGISYDDFIRTSDKKRHWPAAQKLWKQLEERGFLEKRKYEALYCSGCESFVTERDLDEEGNCPNHKTRPEKVAEENWFFKLSEVSDEVKKWLKERVVAVEPEFRAKEIINVVEEGLKDVSFSRPKEVLPWGVDVPGDEEQVMYVWCDALVNYISALGYGEGSEEFEKWWPADVHVVGKDILRFHAAIWPAMLEIAGLPKPKRILVHGFITSEGQKMSKSLGNVVDPLEVAEEWGVDSLRWYLLSEVAHGQDGDFSQVRFKEKYQSELANTIGNLVSRVAHLCEKNLGGDLSGGVVSEGVSERFKEFERGAEKALEEFNLHKYAGELGKYFMFLNAEVERLAPWVLAKEGKEVELKNALKSLAQGIYGGVGYLQPLMPGVSERVFGQFGRGVWENYSEAKEEVETFKKGEILFPRKEA